MTASHPVFKPVTLPDFQNGNDKNLPGAGQTHVIAAPVKQRRPNLLFKVADLPA